MTRGLIALATLAATLTGQAQFSNLGAGLPGLGFPAVTWGDIDNDGDLDPRRTNSSATRGSGRATTRSRT